MGALTSKPQAYRSRPWELRYHRTHISINMLFLAIKVFIRGTKIIATLPEIGIGEWLIDKTRVGPITTVKTQLRNLIIQKKTLEYCLNTFFVKTNKMIIKTN